MRRTLGALALMGAAVGAAVAGAPAPASAHPLGNFTVNVYSGLRVGPERVDVQLVVDMAEIPAFQARGAVEAAGAAYASRACADALTQVELRVNARAAPLRLARSEVAFPPGAGGLNTLRLTCALEADLGRGGEVRDLRFQNRLYDDRVGWREITAVGDGATILTSDVPTTSVSSALTAYPDNLLSSPLHQTSAAVRARPGGPGASSPAGGLGLPRAVGAANGRYTALVGKDLTLGAGALALLVAVTLGAAHALAPGHGKTLMAAYLVGQRGSARQAAAIGLTITLTHTAGVLALGIALSVFTSFAPERLYPWFGIASGAIVVVLGVGLLRRAISRRAGEAPGHHGGHVHIRVPALAIPASGPAPQAHDHDHGHGHGHGHGGHGHGHGGHGHGHGHEPHLHPAGPPGLARRRDLLAMGLAGGIVPTPSAVVVLLAAIALGRAWFGVTLVVAYGVGMAVTLTAAGFVLVRVASALQRRLQPGGRLGRAVVWLPVATAAVVLVAGGFLLLRGLYQL